MEKTFIFAGFGGQGMLLIGKFMAMACMLDGKHVSWLPSYGPEMRGGTANCSVIVSDNPVASPLVNKADVVVAMNRPSLDKFEEHVKPGGVLVISADHGNADDMLEHDKKGNVKLDKAGAPARKTSHSLNPVPCIVFDPESKNEYKPELREGLGISSLAATCIELLGYEPPADYDPSVLVFK